MGLILLEALAAGLVFILIIWWTMFSGRKKGELHDDHDGPEVGPKDGRDSTGSNKPPGT